jgi:uncharacterized protein (DUF2147 family)
MLKLLISALGLMLLASSAVATGPQATAPADPQGEWLDADGLARIKIADCGGHMWGAIAWEKQPGNRDSNNPDPAKRSRPTLGIPLLIDMKPTPAGGKWEGQVYNPKDGEFYKASIRPLTADTLEIKGCGLFGMVCLGQTWTRYINPDPVAAAAAKPPAAASKSTVGTAAAKSAGATTASAAASPATDFCAGVIQASH